MSSATTRIFTIQNVPVYFNFFGNQKTTPNYIAVPYNFCFHTMRVHLARQMAKIPV